MTSSIRLNPSNRQLWAGLPTALALLAACLLAALAVYQGIQLSSRVSGYYDTQIYVEAMHALLRDGKPFYGEQARVLAGMFPERFALADANSYDLFFYPPPSVPLFAWMGWLEPLAAYRVLIVMQTLAAAAMALALVQLNRGCRAEAGGPEATLLAPAILVVVCAPVWHNSVVGNVSVLACACAVGFLCLHERAPILAGTLLAIGAVLKVYPALLIAPSLVSGRWRPALGFAAGCILLAALGLVWLTVDDYFFFVRQLMPWLAAYYDSQLGNQSLYGFFDRLTRWNEIPPFRGDLVLTPSWLKETVSLIGAAILLPSLWLVFRHRTDRELVNRLMYVILAMVPLISPKGHVHVYVFAMPLLFDCLARCGSRPLIVKAILVGAAALWVLPLWSGLDQVHRMPFLFQHLWHSRFAFITLFAVLLTLSDFRQPRPMTVRA